MLRASNLGLSFGADEIFSGLNFSIDRGERAALVGVNGAGKTSLIRILCGELDSSDGNVRLSRGTRIALLPQQMTRFPSGPLLEAVCSRSGDAATALSRMDDIHRQLETVSDTGERNRLLRRLGELQDLAEVSDAYTVSSRAGKVLTGLGFTTADHERPVEEFSGGWRMRAMLASMLLADPDLLLLDEPTNHLDLDARLWLEEYLSRFEGAVWIISHDPGFLDRIVTRVYELEFGSLKTYTGNYSFYDRHKREDIVQREKQARQQAEQKEKLERFIRRFKATESKRFQVRSREKMLEKLEVIRTYRGPKKMRIRFPKAPRSSLRVVELSNVSKVYDHTVFQDASFVIEREDRIGIVGRNGEGKSTLSRILAGLEDPTSGELQHGSNVALGYYSQEVDLELDPGLTVLEQAAAVSPQSSERELRSYLGSFLFTGDDVAKKTGVLSGGEKSRLALARILLSPLNFLVLDEPTNHLDIFSRDILEEALSCYKGTLVLISHDEKLLDSVVEKVYKVEGGTVRHFNGTFAYYLEKRKKHLEELFEQESTKDVKAADSRQDQRERKRTEAAVRNRSYRERRKVEIRLERIEAKIMPLEERKSSLEEQLANPLVIADSSRLVGLQKEHAWLSEQIAEWQKQWDEIAEELE